MNHRITASTVSGRVQKKKEKKRRRRKRMKRGLDFPGDAGNLTDEMKTLKLGYLKSGNATARF